MAAQDRFIQKWPDGHELWEDRRQKILKHPQTCAHAKRGNLPQDYVKATYFTSPTGLQAELAGCHLKI